MHGQPSEGVTVPRGALRRLFPGCSAYSMDAAPVTQPDLIQKILTYCGLADEPPRAPPNAPPPGFRELRYVDDLEFVHDPGPVEPVWSAD